MRIIHNPLLKSKWPSIRRFLPYWKKKVCLRVVDNFARRIQVSHQRNGGYTSCKNASFEPETWNLCFFYCYYISFQDMQFFKKFLFSVINHYHINGLHLFWDTQLHFKFKMKFKLKKNKKMVIQSSLINSAGWKNWKCCSSKNNVGKFFDTAIQQFRLRLNSQQLLNRSVWVGRLFGGRRH